MVELVLIWAIVVSTVLVMLTIFLLILLRRHNTEIQELLSKHKVDNSLSRMLGVNTVRGELNEILGTLKLLTEYDQLAFVTGATSPSLDLIGIKEDSLDFIEIKSLDTKLKSKPQKLSKKKLVFLESKYLQLQVLPR